MGDEILIFDETSRAVSSGGGFDFANFNIANFNISLFLQKLLIDMGDNPIQTIWWLFLHGGWIIVLFLLFFGGREVWLDWRQTLAGSKKKFILLAIDVPRMSEQSVKAVENIFSHFAGAHSSASFLEKWWEGKYQDPISVEIISIEGHVQYLIRCLANLRDLVEASIYAQYPDAEIAQVEDYAASAPSRFPDETQDLYGVEMTPVKSDVYPLKTYIDFEDKLAGEFKDPLAVLLEAFSRLGPGEQAWYQVLILPIDQKSFGEKIVKEIKKLKGEKEEVKRTMMDKALDAPMAVLTTAGEVLFGGGGEPAKKSDDKQMKMLMLSPGERNRLEAVEKKAGKLQFKCKIRFMYVAKKEVFSKAKIVSSFVGSIKQFNTNDLQALKPDMKRTSTGGTMLIFKQRRWNYRKNRIMTGYKSRSPGIGLDPFFLGTDELASIWHLPVILNVKAPQLKKTEAKRVEPPMNIPFG